MVSIRDVAKLAGVSPSTVSRVMNKTANVDSEKRMRVEKAILETGFKPNEVARSLYKKSSKLIGMIVPNIMNPFFNELAEAIERESDAMGFRLTLCNSNDDIEKEKRNLNLLDRMNADGIILMTNREETKEEITRCRVPVVMVDRQIEHSSEIACIESDHYQGGRMAAEHLYRCGCRKIVQLCGPQRFSSSRQRHQAYLDVCGEKGIEAVWMECGFSYEDGLNKAEELLERFPGADGIIAANDMVAISVYKVLHAHGIRVPRDIQLIGFDNITLSRLVTPEITTVAQPIAAMGRAAVRVLTEYIAGEAINCRNIFPVELIKRETTLEEALRDSVPGQ